MKRSFFQNPSENTFSQSFVQEKLEEITSFHDKYHCRETSKALHELDCYLMKHDFDKNLLPEQKKTLSDLYIKIADSNFDRGINSLGAPDIKGVEAFHYLQKAKKLDPTNKEKIEYNLLGMWAETEAAPWEEIKSGQWPPSPFKIMAK